MKLQKKIDQLKQLFHICLQIHFYLFSHDVIKIWIHGKQSLSSSLKVSLRLFRKIFFGGDYDVIDRHRFRHLSHPIVTLFMKPISKSSLNSSLSSRFLSAHSTSNALENLEELLQYSNRASFKYSRNSLSPASIISSL